MVQAYRQDSIDKFKLKYRTLCDVLLLEDVHCLAGKERTQIELASTLDTLHEGSKRIIFPAVICPRTSRSCMTSCVHASPAA